MKEIVNRLQENRQVELAKSILESHGYKVNKLRESDSYGGIRAEEEMTGTEYKIFLSDEGENKQYIKTLQGLGVFSSNTKVYLDAMFYEDYEKGDEITTKGKFNNRLYNIKLAAGTPAILDTNQDGYENCYILGDR